MLVNMKDTSGRDDRGANISARLPIINIDPKTGKVNPIDINERKKHRMPDIAPFYSYDNGFLKESKEKTSPP